MFTYTDHDSREVATVHYFHCDGFLVTEPDPKTITVGNTRYVIHEEPLMKDPEKRYPEQFRHYFTCWYRLMCCLYGPLAKVPLHHQISASVES